MPSLFIFVTSRFRVGTITTNHQMPSTFSGLSPLDYSHLVFHKFFPYPLSTKVKWYFTSLFPSGQSYHNISRIIPLDFHKYIHGPKHKRTTANWSYMHEEYSLCRCRVSTILWSQRIDKKKINHNQSTSNIVNNLVCQRYVKR